ncbi:hypothetical protein THAOC_09414 [Thalassiosira oceanica]|uniref:J domain-containing protein n=1 Tax=Thalassiosira oceanica TaxID=159749 RepID=K0SSN7_THAOC|nr:hypothetical protein THAOC_09414 [Thalassiosira oceanica]|eukprot:EJK69338.1 hypothetical protein THAOC_09414 [Thalassiosira oceanica]
MLPVRVGGCWLEEGEECECSMIDHDDEPGAPVMCDRPDLLELCSLPSSASDEERGERLERLSTWLADYPESTRDLLTLPEYRDPKTGCMPLHWAAGTGFNEAIASIMEFKFEHGLTDLSVDQRAHHPSTGRTPLHYAARNGHLGTCKMLARNGANMHPCCGRGGVTPLQLACWQNRLSIVTYLVEVNGPAVVHERNSFDCGLQHWIGLVPQKRWRGESSRIDAVDDGSGVLPLARYLNSLGVKYDSSADNSNSQGHTPCHKAAWGGNISLIKYFRDEHSVVDTVQDQAGNFCADLARMRGNLQCQEWLIHHCSEDRARSYRVLGLEDGADMETVRNRYLELARRKHPDRLGDNESEEKKEDDPQRNDFITIKAAYDHLVKEGGKGQQSNPKYSDLKLLENHARVNADFGKGSCDDNDLFIARLTAVLSDYGDDGFPISLLVRRWNQIWPERKLPTRYVIEREVKSGETGTMTVRKEVKLLKWLKWKCRGTSVYFRHTQGDTLAFAGEAHILGKESHIS